MKPATRRDGSVWAGERLIGYVDHYNPSAPHKRSAKWRAVRDGGSYRFGFAKRALAIEWLTK